MPDLRYPIGPFRFEGLNEREREECLTRIAAAPARLRAAVAGLTAEQLDTPYRLGGWTVRQVIHHVPDSHLNAYTRVRLALTEPTPTIKPYEEARWAELPDARTAPIDVSLALLDGLHARWLHLLRQLTPADAARAFWHPEHGRDITIDEVIAMYAWHGEHHVAHVTSLRDRMSW